MLLYQLSPQRVAALPPPQLNFTEQHEAGIDLQILSPLLQVP